MSVKLLALGIFVLGACSSSDPAAAPDLGSTDMAMLPTSLSIGPSVGMITTPFDLTISGDGSMRVGHFSFKDNLGTIEILGQTLPAIAYERQPFAPNLLFQALAVAPDRLWLVWLYTNETTGGALTMSTTWIESTAGDMPGDEVATGQGMETMTSHTTPIDFSAVALPIPAPPTPSFTITGDKLSLPAMGPGTLTAASSTFQIYPFATVDCTGCGMGSATPWYELHSVLFDQPGGRLCTGIFYLFTDHSPIELAYTLCMPALDDPIGVTTYPTSDWKMTSN